MLQIPASGKSVLRLVLCSRLGFFPTFLNHLSWRFFSLALPWLACGFTHVFLSSVLSYVLGPGSSLLLTPPPPLSITRFTFFLSLRSTNPPLCLIGSIGTQWNVTYFSQYRIIAFSLYVLCPFFLSILAVFCLVCSSLPLSLSLVILQSFVHVFVLFL